MVGSNTNVAHGEGGKSASNTGGRSVGKPQVSNNKSQGASSRPQTGTNSQSRRTSSKPNSNRNKSKPRESMKRQSMLNTHRLAPFKYDMNEILSASAMDPSKASSLLASVIAKASRVSTRDAKDFVKTFIESGDLTKEEYDRICRLMDRYSKYR